ncbi:MAG: uroporphyrinogen III synthase [Proteobacteria bacterium SW_6_67_9]|nr:MAG: uroporphyrinogen III synthase [Proteobacteria bacterium SW_6_67_9]
MAADELQGRRVLVTRPAERGEALALAIEAAGGSARRWPTIVIEPVASPAIAAGGAWAYDVVLFVSPAAVAYGCAALGLERAVPPPIGVVGAATRAALSEHGLGVAIEPEGSQDTPGLLRAPALAADRIAGRRVLIVRGEGGREDLAAALMARGATVDYAEVYRRRRPSGLDPAATDDCDIVTATSAEGLHNLVDLLDRERRARLVARPLVVNSQRIAAAAITLGFAQRPYVAPAPGDDGLLRAIRAAAAGLAQGPSESA